MADGIHHLAIPTPFAVGRVNCYLVDDDPLTLVDAGPNSGTSLVALAEALREHGRAIEDLERIVLTHQHPDHIGLAQILADRSGAEVVALDALAPWLADYGARMEADDDYAAALMLRHGVPEVAVETLRTVARLARAWGAGADATLPVADGAELPFAGRTWRVHHRPGHSPSDTVFHDEAAGVLVAGDHLIGHISSNPAIALPLDGRVPDERPHALLTYIDSLRATRELELEVVLAGHGDPVHDHRALIDERLRMTERRARKIARLLAERPLTVHEIAHVLWGRIAIAQAYLTLSEVLGHLDLLAARGEVVEHDDGGVARFAPA